MSDAGVTVSRDSITFSHGQALTFPQPTRITCEVPLDASCFPKRADSDSVGWPAAAILITMCLSFAYVLGAVFKAAAR